jgi:hypothetical protein
MKNVQYGWLWIFAAAIIALTAMYASWKTQDPFYYDQPNYWKDESDPTYVSPRQSSSEEQSDIVSQGLYPTFESDGEKLVLPPLGITIRTTEKLHTEAAFVGERRFTISGASMGWLTVESKYYNHPADGIWDWTINNLFAESLRSSYDVCVILRHANPDLVYVPVRVDRPMICESWENEGRTFIIAVGFGHPFEETDFPYGTLIVLQRHDMYIFEGMADFPAFEEQRQKLSDTFKAEHPYVELWPPHDPLAQQYWDDATQLVRDYIEKQGPDTSKAMSDLKKFASSVSFTAQTSSVPAE